MARGRTGKYGYFRDVQSWQGYREGGGIGYGIPRDNRRVCILRIVAGYHAGFQRGRWDKQLHGHMRILGLMRHLGWGTGVAGCWHWGYEHGGINEGSNQPGCFFAKLLEAVLQIVKFLKVALEIREVQQSKHGKGLFMGTGAGKGWFLNMLG